MRLQINSRRISASIFFCFSVHQPGPGGQQPKRCDLRRYVSALLMIGKSSAYKVRLDSLEDAGAVGSAKTERIRHGNAKLHLARRVGDKIKIALRILVFEINGRRYHLVT